MRISGTFSHVLVQKSQIIPNFYFTADLTKVWLHHIAPDNASFVAIMQDLNFHQNMITLWVLTGTADWLCWGFITCQPLWVILCCLPEKGRREIKMMKERNRGERKMNGSEEMEEIKTFPLYSYLLDLPNCKPISVGRRLIRKSTLEIWFLVQKYLAPEYSPCYLELGDLSARPLNTYRCSELCIPLPHGNSSDSTDPDLTAPFTYATSVCFIPS